VNTATELGRLWLIPTPLGDGSDPKRCLPLDTINVAAALDCLIAENAKTARAFLKLLPLQRPIQEIEIRELNEHTPAAALPELLKPLMSGRDVGLLSEAGCPAVADPGAPLVALAHQRGIPVRPLIGPSSILLALMASGLGGQAFSFAGYLPQQPDARLQAARELEQRSARLGETVLMIETPYRNQALFETLVTALSSETRLLVASALTLPEESIQMASIADWRTRRPALPRVPTVFGLLAPPTGRKPGGKPARSR